MKDTAKAAMNSITKKFYGSGDTTHSKTLKNSTVTAPEIKSFIELPNGEIIDEELHEELTETIKATSQALAAARQFLAGGA